jgi:transposase
MKKHSRDEKATVAVAVAVTGERLTVGVDVGDKQSWFCILDEGGEVLLEGGVRTTPRGFQKQFELLGASRIALEVGAHSRWIREQLKSYGHEVLVANARQLPLIYASDRKRDPVDAEKLARLARLDPKLLCPIEHRSGKAQRDLAILRARDLLVGARTKLINGVRGLVKNEGVRIPTCSSEKFPPEANKIMPRELRAALAPLLEQIDSLNQGIGEFDETIRHKAQTEYPETARLDQVPGVGPLTALSFVLTVDDKHRFARSREVGCFLGLRPKQSESGDSAPQLGITKAGDIYLRRLLVNCAQYMLGRFGADTDLRRWGLKLAERGGKNAKKRAVVAVARKLAVLLHRLWVTGEAYEPLRNHPSPSAAKAA